MKKTITKLFMMLGIASTAFSQNIITFDTYTLSPNSYYKDTTSLDFNTNGVTFQYTWNNSWGGFWESGSAYTNINDTINGTYTNIYGCITGNAFSGSNYVTIQDGAVISFSNNTTAINGFYITNTTYAWKTIKNGNQFARKFGDTTGTGSGTSIPQGQYPDWFKILVKGYRGGSMTTDSIEYYLADYRNPGTSNDYVVKNWQFVDCSSLGQVDSIKYILKSSDNSQGIPNTPAFFSIDNFIIQSTVGTQDLSDIQNYLLFPNPSNGNATLYLNTNKEQLINLSVNDISGREIEEISIKTQPGNNQHVIISENLNSGIYFINLITNSSVKKIKYIKTN